MPRDFTIPTINNLTSSFNFPNNTLTPVNIGVLPIILGTESVISLKTNEVYNITVEKK